MGDGFARRDFLTLAGSAVLTSCRRNFQGTPPPEGDPWAEVRAQFNLSPDFVHFASFVIVSHPKMVRDALEYHRRKLDENPMLYVERDDELTIAVAESAAKFLGVRGIDVALTDSTTMGLGLLYGSILLREGDEIITSAHDHYSTHEAVRLAAMRSGAKVQKIKLYENSFTASADEACTAVAKAITPKTRVLALTWLHSGTGVKLPLAAISEVVAKANASRPEAERVLFCVDGVHGLGTEDFKVPDLKVDFFVAGCHKSLFGPRGTGLVWGREQAWGRVIPTIPSFTNPDGFQRWLADEPQGPMTGFAMSPGGIHSYEHRWALIQAFEFQTKVGRAKIQARVHELSRRLKEGLAAMRHVTLKTPLSDDLSSGMACFEVAGMSPRAVSRKLFSEHHIVNMSTPYRPQYARLATGILNTPDEVDKALRAIRTMG